jgi:hypothetical protein
MGSNTGYSVQWLIAATLISLFGCLGCADDSDNNAANKGGEAGTDDGSETELIDHCANPVATTDEDGNILIIAEDSINYTFESHLEVRSVPVQSLANLLFDWSEVSQDMFGRPFDPLEDADMIELMLWRYTKEDLIKDINADTLDTTNLVALGQLPTFNRIDSAELLNLLTPTGDPLDEAELMSYVDTSIYAPDEFSYFIMVAEGFDFGHDTRMISFFEPSPDESNTEVRLTNDSSTLTYSADLTSLKRVAVPPATPDIVFDWLDNTVLVHTATGKEWTPFVITDVLVAHYEDKTPEDLEQEFLDIEEIADELYTVYLTAGQSVNLSRLTDDEGEPFPGIDDVGTWLFALKCESCTNPAPLFMTILHPCP